MDAIVIMMKKLHAKDAYLDILRALMGVAAVLSMVAETQIK